MAWTKHGNKLTAESRATIREIDLNLHDLLQESMRRFDDSRCNPVANSETTDHSPLRNDDSGLGDKSLVNYVGIGGRGWNRTTDPSRVKRMLYR
jgi:hypothetical protein